MSSTTPNLGLTKTTAAETIGQNWAASNDSGGNFDIIDTKMGAVGSQSVQAQLDALNSKTTYNGTANSTYVNALEGKVIKNGNVVSGYFVLTANADFSAANLTLISNLPAAYNQDVQLPCIGLSGTNIYKASRVKITTSGTIVTWYGFGFKSGESYLISVNYICT